ncbi:MAG: 3-deoxy-D-manno-octulosonic acid transferase [Acidobacteria bacterium]|nr:3-deoxy-D-manno-octulosonic acid transferase [Acidobacteriota bacterium]
MYILYNLALLLVLILAAPYLLYQAIVYKKYLANLSTRLGFRQIDNASFPQPKILIHCVSVGEFVAAEPLIEKLHKSLPEYKLIISTTTITGQKLAQERASKFACICYFPLDFSFSVNRFLKQLEPKAIVIMETEIWPNFFRLAKEKKIPLFIANGRISDKSFSRYNKIKFLLKSVLDSVTCFMMQSSQDADRILALGAKEEKVKICGNIKYDLGMSSQADRLDKLALDLGKKLHLEKNSPLILAGSTTPGEEEILIAAYLQTIKKTNLSNTRLLIAPRRPERFDEVANLLVKNDLIFIRRSKISSDNSFTNNGVSNNKAERIILLDSIGELAAIYRYGQVVFVGGSLVPYGGHNILEPALYKRAIITGPYMNNFQKIATDFLSAQALVQLPILEKEELINTLAEKFIYLLENNDICSQLGKQAYQVIENNRGALDQHIKIICQLLIGAK